MQNFKLFFGGLLLLFAFTSSFGQKFTWSLDVEGNQNFGFKQRKVQPVTKIINTPIGKQQLNLIPRYNSRIKKKTNNGHKCATNDTFTNGYNLDLNLGFASNTWGISTGANYQKKGHKEFYFTDSEHYPLYMEESKLSSVGIPLTFSFGNFEEGILFYAKSQYNFNLMVKQKQYIGGMKFVNNVDNDSGLKNNISYGIGFKLKILDVGVDYVPEFLDRNYTDANGLKPYSNLPKGRFYYHVGLSINKHIKELFNGDFKLSDIRKFKKQAKLLKQHEADEYDLYFGKLYLGIFYTAVGDLAFDKVGYRYQSTQSPLNGEVLGKEGSTLEDTYIPPNFGISVGALWRSGFSIVADIKHTTFKKLTDVVYDIDDMQYYSTKGEHKVNSIGIDLLLKYKQFNLGGGVDFPYRYKGVMFNPSNGLSEFIEFSSPKLNKIVPSLIAGYSFIQIQYFPQSVINTQFTDDVGIRPFLNLKNSYVMLNCKFNLVDLRNISRMMTKNREESAIDISEIYSNIISGFFGAYTSRELVLKKLESSVKE